MSLCHTRARLPLTRLLMGHSLLIIIRLFFLPHKLFNASRHCSLPLKYIIQSKTVLLASENANPTFDYHNQLMYEKQCVCVAACQIIVCILLLQSSTLVAYTSYYIFSPERGAWKRTLEAQFIAVHSKGKSPTYMPSYAFAKGNGLCHQERKVCEYLSVNDGKCARIKENFKLHLLYFSSRCWWCLNLKRSTCLHIG